MNLVSTSNSAANQCKLHKYIYIFYFCRLKGQEASEAKQIIEVNQLIEQNEKEKPTNSKGLRFAKVIGNLRLPGLTKPLLAT